MKTKYDHYQEHREWEIFEEEEITHLTFENGLYNLAQDCIITIKRDDQFDLVATIRGTAENRKELESNESQTAGTFAAKENIIAFSKDGIYKYKLEGIVIGKISCTHISMEKPTIKFEAELLIDGIEKSQYIYSPKIEVIQEWFLSAKSQIAFPGTTKRSVNKIYKKIREQVDDENSSRPGESSGMSRDFIHVKTSDFNFI